MRFITAIVIVLISSIMSSAQPCTSSASLLFGEDALVMLDSLQRETSRDHFTIGILMHNLAFRTKDDAMTRIAIAHFDSASVPQGDRWLLEAYRASAALISVRDQASVSKVARSFFGSIPFSGVRTPKDQANEIFKLITEALHYDSTNLTIRLIRATAAVESAEHLPSLMKYAREDLMVLDRLIVVRMTREWQGQSSGAFSCDQKIQPPLTYDHEYDVVWKIPLPSVASADRFFVRLTWAKFHYKNARYILGSGRKTERQRRSSLMDMLNELAAAGRFACTPSMRYELLLWQSRFDIAFSELDD